MQNDSNMEKKQNNLRFCVFGIVIFILIPFVREPPGWEFSAIAHFATVSEYATT